MMMMTITFRECIITDLTRNQLLGLLILTNHERGCMERDAWRAWAFKELVPVVIAYDDNMPVGWCLVAFNEGWSKKLIQTFVQPASRGKGIGRQLVRTMQKRVPLPLFQSVSATEFYRKALGI